MTPLNQKIGQQQLHPVTHDQQEGVQQMPW